MRSPGDSLSAGCVIGLSGALTKLDWARSRRFDLDVMNVIDFKSLARDAGGNPLSDFRHRARGSARAIHVRAACRGARQPSRKRGPLSRRPLGWRVIARLAGWASAGGSTRLCLETIEKPVPCAPHGTGSNAEVINGRGPPSDAGRGPRRFTARPFSIDAVSRRFPAPRAALEPSRACARQRASRRHPIRAIAARFPCHWQISRRHDKRHVRAGRTPPAPRA